MIRTEALAPEPWRERASLARGMAVRAIDGKVVGSIDGAVPGWVIVRTGWLAPKRHRISTRRIREVRGREVLVDFTANELGTYPQYLTDAELERTVLERIGDLPGLSVIATSSIWVCSRDGVVTLGGNVPNRFYREKVVEAALRTPGVLDVVDRLVADELIKTHLATELERQPGTSDITVDSELGRVVLRGEVSSEDDAVRAVRVARAVNGVRAVVDEIARRDRPETEPAGTSSGGQSTAAA